MSCCLDQTHCKNWTWQRDPWFTPSYQQSVKHETQITEMGDTSQKWMDPSKFPTSQAFWQCRTGSHLVSSFRQDGSATIYFYTFRMREKKKGTRCQYKKLQSWVLRRHRFVDKKTFIFWESLWFLCHQSMVLVGCTIASSTSCKCPAAAARRQQPLRSAFQHISWNLEPSVITHW